MFADHAEILFAHTHKHHESWHGQFEAIVVFYHELRPLEYSIQIESNSKNDVNIRLFAPFSQTMTWDLNFDTPF